MNILSVIALSIIAIVTIVLVFKLLYKSATERSWYHIVCAIIIILIAATFCTILLLVELFSFKNSIVDIYEFANRVRG